ncbi:MAG: histidine kinase dimerization/phospho-acceptor domain-containing protein, partial [Bradyrhizobium sp.]
MAGSRKSASRPDSKPGSKGSKGSKGFKGSKTAERATGAGVVETALAVFAHEVRTPLTGILAISDLLATSELGERERRWVDTIKAGAEHLSSLAILFVDAAKGEATG